MLLSLRVDDKRLLITFCAVGETIIQQGDVKDTNFYMLEEGEAVATKVLDESESSEPTVVFSYKAGDYFGERRLTSDEPRGANVVAITDCRCITLDRQRCELSACVMDS